MKALLTRILCGVAVLLLAPALAFGQDTGTVEGLVTDGDTGDPLPGANVTFPDLDLGTATNASGVYTIEEVPAGTHTLQVTFIGYRTTERDVTVEAGETLEADFVLGIDRTDLEEVVVTGIASRTSRSRAEVSVSSVDAEELTVDNTYSGISELLGSKVSGVNVQRSSGNVGGGFTFNVRSGGGIGGGEPLIYVDGIRVDNTEVIGFGSGGQGVSTLANLNPEDIQNVEILKGPAGAALYGTQGSNGVVLITTKSGQRGTPLSIRYKSVLGVNQQIQDYDYSTSGTPDAANAFYRDGGIQEHTLSASGGTDIVRYFTSLQYRGEDGILRNNSLDRNAFRANIEAFPTDDLTLSAKASFSRADATRPQNDNNVFGYVGNTVLGSSPFVFTDSTSIELASNLTETNTFSGSIQTNYSPIDGLELRASAGYDGSELRNDETLPPEGSYVGITNGQRSIFQRRNEQFTYDINARYAFEPVEDLRSTTIVGGQAFDRTVKTFNIVRQNFGTSLISSVGAGADFQQGDEGFLDVREAGVFAQQELAYQDTYFFTFGGRQDFATVVGQDAGNIFYPKVSGALRLDQFDFTPDFVDLLKLRAAYGETGDLPGSLDGILLQWGSGASGYGQGALISGLGNPNIEPERVSEFEVGLEADLFGRATLSTTYYRNNATESIIDFNEAPSTGLVASARPVNIGEKTGQGVELDLSVTPIQKRNFSLTADFIYAYTTNTIEDLGGAQPIFDGFDVNVTRVGLPQGAFYSFTSDAQFVDADGNPLEDGFAASDVAGFQIVPGAVDENGVPTREYLGQPVPEHSGSFSLSATIFRNLNVYGLIDFTGGLRVFNNTKLFQTDFGTNKELNEALYLLSDQATRFDGATPEQLVDANFPYLADLEINSVTPGSERYLELARTVASNQTTIGGFAGDGNFIEDADYIRLREISVSYDFSSLIERAVPEAGIEALTFGLSARNLLTITDYSGIDPEVNFDGARSGSRGTDFLTLAQPRTLTATLNVRF